MRFKKNNDELLEKSYSYPKDRSNSANDPINSIEAPTNGPLNAPTNSRSSSRTNMPTNRATEPPMSATTGPLENIPKEAPKSFNICPRCGNSNSLKARWCTKCGAQLKVSTESVVCHKCHLRNSPLANFCRNCGTTLKVVAPQTKICPRCGREIGAEENICVCGYSFITGERRYRNAAEHGDADAQYNLGNCYYNGECVGGYDEAVKWYLKAAKQGHVDAQKTLGEHFYYYEKDYPEAIKWFRKAAKNGSLTAQYFLGVHYFYGKEGDDIESIKWWRRIIGVKWWHKAAKKGDVYSQMALGNCYEMGDGTLRSHAKAVKWYRKAAESGSIRAINWLKRHNVK